MALRIAGSQPSWTVAQPITSSELALSCAVIARSSSRSYNGVVGVRVAASTTRRKRESVVARSRLEVVAGASLVGTVTEVDKDTFWPIVNGAGDKTAVLDMYIQWY